MGTSLHSSHGAPQQNREQKKLNVPNLGPTALANIPTSPLKAFLIASEMENRLSSSQAGQCAGDPAAQWQLSLPSFQEFGASCDAESPPAACLTCYLQEVQLHYFGADGF